MKTLPKYAKAMKLRDARANFSRLTKAVGKEVTTYIVENRGREVTYLVDPATAKKYLPKKLTAKKPKLEKTGGQLFAEGIRKWQKEHPRKPGTKVENISGNVDEIVYGI